MTSLNSIIIPLNITIKPDDYRKLETYVAKQNTNLSEFVNVLVDMSIKELEGCGEI